MLRMKLFASLSLCLILSLPALAHDLFLKLDHFFVEVNAKVRISVLNGSFVGSEGAVTFARLKDLSVVSPSGSRTNPKEEDFTKNDTTAFLNLQPQEAGTFVAGLSMMPREIDLKGKSFNEYLAEDGIPDILAERKRKNELRKNVRERYSKHVKTIFQVSNTQTDSYKTVLGYPVELVPQQNPYILKAGDTIEILCLKEGQPLVNQFVMSGRENAGKDEPAANVRTDKKGIARIKLNAAGKWYVKFINMTRLNDPKINYESKWATLTFALN